MIELLLVEDDPGDVELTIHALEEAKIRINFNSVGDGVEALQYLNRQGQYAHTKLPDLILLDLNLPRMGGHEFLQNVRADQHLCHIPVVVLTTSDDEQDILHSYQLGASSYITKPVGLEEFSQIVHSLECFWFTIVKFPPR